MLVDGDDFSVEDGVFCLDEASQVFQFRVTRGEFVLIAGDQAHFGIL